MQAVDTPSKNKTRSIGVKTLTVTSTAFSNGDTIPFRYTCEGEDINPPLDIHNLPRESKSLVVMVEDSDAPTGNWLHWLAWNIPATHHIPENEMRGYQGVNDLGRKCYGGPCPPSEMHRYYFKIFALDRMLSLHEGASKKDVDAAMHGHVVAYGDIMGICERSPYH